MKRSARTLGFTITASLALHGVLILVAAWLMAVLPERKHKRPDSLLISPTDQWSYRKGTSAPQSGWQTIADEALDATWFQGRGWIGYGAGNPGTVLDDMRRTPAAPGYRVLYLRKTFTVSANLPATHEAVLDIDYDDGFIAWIDGKYVDHEGLPGDPPAEPAWDSDVNVPAHECSFGNLQREPQPVRSKVVGALGKTLTPGTHILSVLLINESIDSEDAVAKVELYTRAPLPEEAPESKAAEAESLDEVTVTFVPADEMGKGKSVPVALEPAAAGSQRKDKKFVRADGSQAEANPLNEDTAFISSQNMRAASTAAPDPTGDPNRISQEGTDIPVFSLNSADFSNGESSPPPAPPSPPAPQETPEPAPPEPPSPDPVKAETTPPAPPPPVEDRPPDPNTTVKTDDPLAPAPVEKPKEKKLDTPPMRDRPPEPLPMAKAPQPTVRKALPVDPVAGAAKPAISARKSKSKGAIALRAGKASEDAKDTPEGRYHSIMQERVAVLWNARLAGVRGIAGAGVVEVEYDIDSKGAVSNVKLVDPGKANAVLEDVCLTAIIKVKLPPPPEEMLRELRDPLSSGKIHCTFTFYRL